MITEILGVFKMNIRSYAGGILILFFMLGCWIDRDCSAKDAACGIRELGSFVDLVSFISGCARITSVWISFFVLLAGLPSDQVL
ncbi:unnamed protein product [Urochloa humidicola]